jgi:DNA-directed RNA polymerase sigma subunit (sigma70/sigma32)
MVVDSRTRRALTAVAALSDLEQRIVVWRAGLFGQPELSVQEIACRLNVRCGAVRVIEKRALNAIGEARTTLCNAAWDT